MYAVSTQARNCCVIVALVRDLMCCCVLAAQPSIAAPKKYVAQNLRGFGFSRGGAFNLTQVRLRVCM